MRKTSWLVALAVLVLFVPSALAADLYVRVYINGCNYIWPPCGDETTWTSYAVIESRLYGFPFVVSMSNSHTVYENNHRVDSSGGGQGWWSDWDSHLQGFARVPECYRAQAHSFAGQLSQGAGTGQICWQGPVMCQELNCNTPVIINPRSGGYRLTSAEDGVSFDIDADGINERVAWTGRNTELVFLALDRNRNGKIDDGSELFGNHTSLANGEKAPNGFEAIAELDTNGDAILSSGDSAWDELLLWLDSNHDGRSTSEELVSIRTSEIEAISTDYRWSPRRDKFGNEFRYVGEVLISGTRRKCYDVYLLTSD